MAKHKEVLWAVKWRLGNRILGAGNPAFSGRSHSGVEVRKK